MRPSGETDALPMLLSPAPAKCRDSDSDGLPDAWELAHGLNENDPVGENGPYGDPDLDGLSNLPEFLAGTNPRDAQSYLKIESISCNSREILTFNAVSNKSYTVQSTPALGGSPWFPLVDIPARATNHVAVVMDPAAAPNRFYRLPPGNSNDRSPQESPDELRITADHDDENHIPERIRYRRAATSMENSAGYS